ncbi:SDR family oxidoreductase [Egicoccus sp. AB-alg2]|uniref:SDR family oxidoreductase n=1 Tax=Egicoccus sp. AB-alg2 TaxID=3242693 RepID=UPI00359E33C0
MRVLVIGATGYIGGRLVPELLARGHQVRCGARTPQKLDHRLWRDEIEVARVDVADRDQVRAAADGCEVVYYLVHSMDGAGGFEERDRQAARNVRDAVAEAGVRRLVYLGGLGHGPDLSPHLRSRQEVGRLLAEGPVPVTELRAAIIIGSGSASFEMLRHLVEVLPVMVTPRWVETRCQPIAVRDVLGYLADVAENPHAAGVLEIAGPDVLTYRQLMQVYAEVAGLRHRVIVPVPVLTPSLSSLWIGLVTPLPTGLARPLVESLVNEVVVQDDTAERLLPRERLPIRAALLLALERVQDLEVATTWAGAGGTPSQTPKRHGPEAPRPEDPDWSGGTVLADERRVRADAPPAAVFEAVSGIGGHRGYHGFRWMWETRGILDKVVGGVGLRRGRRHPVELAVGEPVDFWRVEALEPDRLLRLRAEMKVPGAAWLEFRIEPDGDGSRLEQRARFHPRGLFGRLYWRVLTPFHALIFPRMARQLAREAERLAAEDRARAGPAPDRPDEAPLQQRPGA